jgi:hypothetical protein
VHRYALDASDWFEEPGKDQVSSESVAHFLAGVKRAPAKSHPSLRLGENARSEADSVSGASLAHQGRGRHVSALNFKGHKSDRSSLPEIFSKKEGELARES